MRTRSLRRIYTASFGLSLIGHLALIAALSRISLQDEGIPDPRAGESREWLQLLDIQPAILPDVQPTSLPIAQEAPHPEPGTDHSDRHASASADQPVTVQASGLTLPGAGDVRPAGYIRERMRGTRDARLSVRTHPDPADHRGVPVANERLRTAIEATNDSLATAKRDFTYHLARGYHMDGRRILPVDGVAWQRYELFQQNERFARDSLAKERGRTARERGRPEHTARAAPR